MLVKVIVCFLIKRGHVHLPKKKTKRDKTKNNNNNNIKNNPWAPTDELAINLYSN